VNTKRIITFILISYGFSWSIWGRQALQHNFDLGWTISPWNHLVAGLGPFIGAIVTTLLFDKKEGLFDFFQQRLFSFPAMKWILIGIGMPVMFFLMPALAFGLLQNEWIIWTELGLNSKVPLTNSLSIWLMWCFFYGLGEEGGWRGFLFPELCKKYKARIATLYIAFIWATWHLPIFFYDKDFQAMGIGGVLGWVIGLVFGSLLLGWLVKQSKWSLWPVILWHGTFNLFTTSDLINPVYPAVMSGLVIAVSLWIARRYGEDLAMNNKVIHSQ
jgi:membrane protease YdiL (CAAX protease family)